MARLNDPGICVEVPITAPAYRVDIRQRPPESNRGRPAQSRPQQPPRGRRTPS